MSTSDGSQGTGAPADGLTAVLLEVARNLRSPPLLFAFGVIVAIVLAAIVACDALEGLQLPVIVLGAGAILAWLVVEFLRARRRVRSRVAVRTKRVAQTGYVSGVEGQPADREVPEVDVRAEDVEGTVRGVVFGPPPGERDGRRD
jgi:hypothetical protein